ncbi:hypothetical protein K3495_g17009, partial [Podosphaera aphanis]
MWIVVYVDDIAAAAQKNEDIDWFAQKLSSRFNTKDLGEISKILGIRVVRNRVNREITLDQEEYLEEALTRFGFTHAQKDNRKVPISDITQLRPTSDEDELIDVKEYQQIIGTLMYSM